MIDPQTGKSHSEESWEAVEYHCYGYFSEIATSLEELGYYPAGVRTKYRSLCKEDGF